VRVAGAASIGALIGLLWVLGCSDDRGMPDPAVCQGECGSGAEGVVGASTGSGGTGGSGGSSGASGSSNTPVELGGTVLRLNDLDFGSAPAEAYRDIARVTAEGAAAVSVSVDYNGFDPFVLTGVRRAEEVWTLVEPADSSADAMPTLQPLFTADAASSGALELDVALLRESVLDAAYSVVPNPVVVEPSRAHVVLLFLDGDDPIPGVSVSAPTAARVVYAVGGTYSDDATETDDTGLVLLANLPASDWPGSAVQVTVSGAAVGSFATRIVSDAVTIAAYAR
jgi:hypothetical protein